MFSNVGDVWCVINLPGRAESKCTIGRCSGCSCQHQLERRISARLGNGRFRNRDEHFYSNCRDREHSPSSHGDRLIERGFVVGNPFCSGSDDGKQLDLFTINRNVRRQIYLHGYAQSGRSFRWHDGFTHEQQPIFARGARFGDSRFGNVNGYFYCVGCRRDRVAVRDTEGHRGYKFPIDVADDFVRRQRSAVRFDRLTDRRTDRKRHVNAIGKRF